MSFSVDTVSVDADRSGRGFVVSVWVRCGGEAAIAGVSVEWWADVRVEVPVEGDVESAVSRARDVVDVVGGACGELQSDVALAMSRIDSAVRDLLSMASTVELTSELLKRQVCSAAARVFEGRVAERLGGSARVFTTPHMCGVTAPIILRLRRQ